MSKRAGKATGKGREAAAEGGAAGFGVSGSSKRRRRRRGTHCLKGRPRNDANCTVKPLNQRAEENGVSRRTQIMLDRIARDFPEHQARIKFGESTVHGAYIEVGLADRTVPIPSTLPRPIAAFSLKSGRRRD